MRRAGDAVRGLLPALKGAELSWCCPWEASVTAAVTAFARVLGLYKLLHKNFLR